MDGDCLVLLDGKVHAMAKRCAGWDAAVKLELYKFALNLSMGATYSEKEGESCSKN
jgi:hypothetical protein